MDIAIIDYKMSNLHSVQAACSKVGLSSVITSDKSQILDAKAAILPGVGAFGNAMAQLVESKLDECIFRFVDSGKLFIGICLGLQLLFETSEEFGSHRGLGIIKGSVKKFQFRKSESTKFPVPQIGWNRIQNTGNLWDNTLLCNNLHNDFMYFVHSYYVKPANDEIVLSNTVYGTTEYCSSIKYNNIFASQFHPEKSGLVGLTIYNEIRNYLINL